MAEPQRIKEILEEKSENLNVILQHTSDVVSDDEGTLEVEKPKNGGARAGAGRPKGSIAKSTRTALEIKTHFINRVHANVDTLFNAQLALAKGESFLFAKSTSGEGKDRKVTVSVVDDEDTISSYLEDDGYTLNSDADDVYYYISTKAANNQAIDSLLNRAFGKAPEKIEIEGGFFKVDKLLIQIVNPEHIMTENEQNGTTNTDRFDGATDAEIITETESGANAS